MCKIDGGRFLGPPYNLRLVKETVRINNVQPLDFVSLINHTNANVNVNVNGGGGGGGGGGGVGVCVSTCTCTAGVPPTTA